MEQKLSRSQRRRNRKKKAEQRRAKRAEMRRHYGVLMRVVTHVIQHGPCELGMTDQVTGMTWDQLLIAAQDGENVVTKEMLR